MLIRVFVNRIHSKQNFKSMLLVGTPQEAIIPEGLAITDEEYHRWRCELDQLTLSDSCFEKLYTLKQLLENGDNLNTEDGLRTDLYISDRRWKKAVKLLKASAYFNGRDEINPLDLLLLKNCLWHNPDSRLVVERVIEAFAINHAFDQNVIQQKIELCQQLFNDIQQEIEAGFSILLSDQVAGTLFRKGGYQYDLSPGKAYQVGEAKGLLKLVMLENNMSVNEVEKGDSRWVYVARDDLEKVIREAGGEAYGYVNQNSNLCLLRFDVNADNSLVVKDIANRSVLVGLVTTQGLDPTLYQRWSDKVSLALDELSAAEQHLRQVKSDFHGALPHSFIDSELPTKMESSLQSLQEQLEATKIGNEKLALRIRHLDQLFT
jgi:MoxR-like ATPase